MKVRRFNLSILECKCFCAIRLLLAMRFNLSILECKYDKEYKTVAGHVVLIYPYWNVNIVTQAVETITTAVLIYPYWNVNLSDWDGGKATGAVLIYPYWNVNSSSSASWSIFACFNLSILECKCMRTSRRAG